MNCCTPSFLVLHYLPKFAQTHIHWIGDAIQPSYPLSSPSLPAFNLFQHLGLFQWMGSLATSGGQRIGASASALVPPMNIQGSSPLGVTSLISLLSKGLSRVFSSTTVQRHHFFALSLLYCPALTYMTTGKTTALTVWTFVRKVMPLLFNMLSRFALLFFQGASVF